MIFTQSWIASSVITHPNPRILHDLIDGQPLLGLDAEHALDEILRGLAHVLPLGVREVVLAGPDAGLHSRGDGQPVVGVERREAAQSVGRNGV